MTIDIKELREALEQPFQYRKDIGHGTIHIDDYKALKKAAQLLSDIYPDLMAVVEAREDLLKWFDEHDLSDRVHKGDAERLAFYAITANHISKIAKRMK